jgi:hypothetical protein
VWFHADGTAWSVLEEYETLIIDCRVKSGNFNQLGPWDFEMTGRLLTVTITHGRGPTAKGLSYAYVIMPNITVETISAFWERYLFIGNNAHALTYLNSAGQPFYLHGACDPSNKRASVALFDQGFTNGSQAYYNCSAMSLNISMEQPGGILFSENSDNFTITAAHPTVSEGTFVVNVNRSSVATSECTNSNLWDLQGGTRVILTLPGTSELLGKSVSVTCKKNNM